MIIFIDVNVHKQEAIPHAEFLHVCFLKVSPSWAEPPSSISLRFTDGTRKLSKASIAVLEALFGPNDLFCWISFNKLDYFQRAISKQLSFDFSKSSIVLPEEIVSQSQYSPVLFDSMWDKLQQMGIKTPSGLRSICLDPTNRR